MPFATALSISDIAALTSSVACSDSFQAVAGNESEQATEDVRAAISEIDKAVAKGIVHKNTAARKKSRLMKKLNAAG